MKKIISVILALGLCIGLLAGCANEKGSKESKEEETFADEAFISDLASALEARWSVIDVQSSGDADERENFEEAVDTELNILKEYENEKFEDSKLKELCIQYINCLKDQKESLKYYTADIIKYEELWSEAYNTRTKILAQMKEEYDFSVSEKYQSTFDDLLTNAQIIKDEESTKAKVEEFIKSIAFTVETDEYGLKTYVAVVENTTGFGFKTLSLTINLLDADGVILETTYSNVENFGSGQKARFEFMTDKEFSSTDVKADYYELDK